MLISVRSAVFPCAGLSTLLASLAVTGFILFKFGTQPFLFICDHWVGLVTASLVMAVAQVYLGLSVLSARAEFLTCKGELLLCSLIHTWDYARRRRKYRHRDIRCEYRANSVEATY